MPSGNTSDHEYEACHDDANGSACPQCDSDEIRVERGGRDTIVYCYDCRKITVLKAERRD